MGASEVRDGKASFLRAGGLESRGQSLCLLVSGDVLGEMEGTPLLRFELQKVAREMAFKR